MKNKDQIQGFLFDDANIKGFLVQLDNSFLEAVQHHNYPEIIKSLVGEFMVSVALISSTIKMPGTISIQAQGTGNLSLIVAECTNKHSLRAVARWHDSLEGGLQDLLGEGKLAITLNPEKGQRYQGIVPLVGEQLAQSLESYFSLSEQIPSRVWITTDPKLGCCGLLLQRMPSEADNTMVEDENWNRICHLTDTITNDELQQLDNEQLLFRLYHDESVRIFPQQQLKFQCSCSQKRIIESLVALGDQEVSALFKEQQIAQVKCEFCNKKYNLSYNDLQPYLLKNNVTEVTQGETIH